MPLRFVLIAATLEAVLADSHVGADGTDECPGSPQDPHAWFKISVETNVDCDRAKAEVKARAEGDGWSERAIGMSTALLEDGEKIRVERRSQRFTDHVLFSFSGTSSSCTIVGCSESQGRSMSDFGSNFCNSYNLVCGLEDGCCPATMGSEYVVSEPTTMDKSSASSKNMAVCTGDEAGSGATGSKPVINCRWTSAPTAAPTPAPSAAPTPAAQTPAPTPAPSGSSNGGDDTAGAAEALSLRLTSLMALAFPICTLFSI